MKRSRCIIVLLGLGLVLAASSTFAQSSPSCDVAGAWVGNAPPIPGVYDIGFVVTEAVSPMDPSGHRFTAVTQPVNGDPTFGGLFPDADLLRGALGTYVRTGPRTFQVGLVDYFVKSAPTGSFERGEILYFERFNGTAECLDANTKVFSGNVSLYSNVDRPDLVVPPLGIFGVHDQDADDDGIADEGEVPFVAISFAVTYKRLP
jgi:hypothetical protein